MVRSPECNALRQYYLQTYAWSVPGDRRASGERHNPLPDRCIKHYPLHLLPALSQPESPVHRHLLLECALRSVFAPGGGLVRLGEPSLREHNADDVCRGLRVTRGLLLPALQEVNSAAEEFAGRSS